MHIFIITLLLSLLHSFERSNDNNNSTGSNEDGGSLHVGRHSLRGIDG